MMSLEQELVPDSSTVLFYDMLVRVLTLLPLVVEPLREGFVLVCLPMATSASSVSSHSCCGKGSSW